MDMVCAWEEANVRGTVTLTGQAAHKQEEQDASGRNGGRKPRLGKREGAWSVGKMRKPGNQGLEASHDPASGRWRCAALRATKPGECWARRAPGAGVPGGWHQQERQPGPNRALRQKAIVSSWLGWWLGHPTGSPVGSAQEWDTLRVHRRGCSSVSPSPAPDLDALPSSAGQLHCPPELLQWTKIYSPFYLGGGEEAKGHFIQAFLPQSSFKNSLRRG